MLEGFNRNCLPSDWDKLGGQGYGLAINPRSQSLEELMIAISSGAGVLI